jgi:hypothetical protein
MNDAVCRLRQVGIVNFGATRESQHATLRRALGYALPRARNPMGVVFYAPKSPIARFAALQPTLKWISTATMNTSTFA